MPLPPILEIYVVWHPDDDHVGLAVAEGLLNHFHSPTFSGLAGGAVEVYVRSAPWTGSAPRPLPYMNELPADLPTAELTAVVPIVGTGLARAVQDDQDWRTFIGAMTETEDLTTSVGVFPVRDPNGQSGPLLTELLGRFQAAELGSVHDPVLMAREMSQAIVQSLFASRAQEALAVPENAEPVTIFVSHTKRGQGSHPVQGPAIVPQVRAVLENTHLNTFFDAYDIQVGTDWQAAIRERAARSAMLIVRTDEYAGRDWTQEEVLVAKRCDLPIVTLHALDRGEERGSFLMDHMPVVEVDPRSADEAIERALGRLVDEVLKRALWNRQSVYLKVDGFDWMPSNAPEPTTILPWLSEHKNRQSGDPHLWIMHPDPPLGSREQSVLIDACELAGFGGKVDIFTPRTFASRGGEV